MQHTKALQLSDGFGQGPELVAVDNKRLELLELTDGLGQGAESVGAEVQRLEVLELTQLGREAAQAQSRKIQLRCVYPFRLANSFLGFYCL